LSAFSACSLIGLTGRILALKLTSLYLMSFVEGILIRAWCTKFLEWGRGEWLAPLLIGTTSHNHRFPRIFQRGASLISF